MILDTLNGKQILKQTSSRSFLLLRYIINGSRAAIQLHSFLTHAIILQGIIYLILGLNYFALRNWRTLLEKNFISNGTHSEMSLQFKSKFILFFFSCLSNVHTLSSIIFLKSYLYVFSPKILVWILSFYLFSRQQNAKIFFMYKVSGIQRMKSRQSDISRVLFKTAAFIQRKFQLRSDHFDVFLQLRKSPGAHGRCKKSKLLVFLRFARIISVINNRFKYHSFDFR